jgi:hypothetical protein
MQDITRKAVRPSDSEEHVKFRSIQADEYIMFRADFLSIFFLAENLRCFALWGSIFWLSCVFCSV